MSEHEQEAPMPGCVGRTVVLLSVLIAGVVGVANLLPVWQTRTRVFPTAAELAKYGRPLSDVRVRRGFLALMRLVFRALDEGERDLEIVHLKGRRAALGGRFQLYSEFALPDGECKVFSLWPKVVIVRVVLKRAQGVPSAEAAHEVALRLVRLPAESKFALVSEEGEAPAGSEYLPCYELRMVADGVTYDVQVEGSQMRQLSVGINADSRPGGLEHAAKILLPYLVHDSTSHLQNPSCPTCAVAPQAGDVAFVVGP